jgi:peptidyl-prolyl cis-trans isomerase D
MVLQAIRDRLHGIIAIFIFAILIIPFAFVGVNSYFTSDAVNSVAVVNDQEITLNEYNQAFQNYRRRMQSQMGDAFDADAFDQLIIRRQFIDRMIDEELLSQLSIDAGLAVTDERLSEEIRGMAGFEVDGEFNLDVYQQRLAAQGMSPQQFENDVRVSLVMNQFPQAIGSSAISTDWEVNDYVRLQEQKRAFSAIVVPAATPEEGVEEAIEEEAILAWYESNQGDYMSEEQVVIEYIELEAATLGGAVEPDEELLRARFEEQEARFITPEARLASHILIEVDTDAPQVDVDSARELAEELSARARDGEDFAALARESSQDLGSAEEGGDLGWIEPGYMVQAFEDALYELSIENPISEPIQTGFGWHVIQLREIRPAEGMSYSEARDLLLAEYQAEADERRFIEQADRMIDIIYEDPTTLSAAADELGLQIQQTEPFGRAGGQLGVTSNMEFVNTAFSDLVLAQASVSDPVDLGMNHIALLHLKEHLPAAVRPLEDVRDEVVEAITRQRAMDAAAATAEELLAGLNAGQDLQALADSTGLALVTTESDRRTNPDVSSRLLQQVFLMDVPAEGSSEAAVFETEDGYALVRLDTVTDGVISEEEAFLTQAYKRRIGNATASAEAIAFLRMLRAQSTIEVFEDRL